MVCRFMIVALRQIDRPKEKQTDFKGYIRIKLENRFKYRNLITMKTV